MTGWHLVIGFDRPYGGEEIVRDRGLRIKIPFGSQASARVAMGEVRMSVERSAPEVIQGEVVADVPAITAAEVTGRSPLVFQAVSSGTARLMRQADADAG